MKAVAFAVLLVVLVCSARASPIEDNEMDIPAVFAQEEIVQSMDLFDAGRQRICTAALCHNVCRSLGWRTGSCNAQLICVCRR